MLTFTREVSPAIRECELTHLARQPIDFELAARQHESYERCLTDLGCRVCRVPGATGRVGRVGGVHGPACSHC